MIWINGREDRLFGSINIVPRIEDIMKQNASNLSRWLF